jgi:hypothetical protein
VVHLDLAAHGVVEHLALVAGRNHHGARAGLM